MQKSNNRSANPFTSVNSACGMGPVSCSTQIAKKIKNWSERIEVIGKYFNPVSGEIEYKLSNGNYVPINSEFEYEISNDDMEELFGCEFIRDFDICAFRDSQIDKII